MNTTLKRLAFVAMLALSLVASTGTAFAKDNHHGRETAWTDEGPLPPLENVVDPLGVTWEE